MIKINNLKLRYSERFSLSVDNFSVDKGKIFTIIGPNGAGKTTLLNIIAMFDKVDNGSVEIFGEDIAKIKNKLLLRRKMSFVFSQPYLLKRTVFENISLPLKLRSSFNKARVEKMLELFKISHLRDRFANSLSQGEKHRVSLARAFIMGPKLILLDEPFLSLDKRYKESLVNELRQIIKLNKITAIFVTQDHFEALSMADTIAVMIDGRILQQGTPQAVFTRPVSKDVADFVGVETILDGRIIKKENNLCFIKAADKVLEAVSIYNEGDDVFVCIRPEDVVVATHLETSSARNHFKAKIINIEPWGLEYKLNLECGFNLVSYVTKQSIENLGLRIGQEIFVSFKATAIHLIKR